MPQAIHISPIDNVVVALHPIAKGTLVEVDGLAVTALEDIPQGHKMAVKPIKNGENVIKYGFPIGHATADAQPGTWMHTHNVHTNLSGEVEYSYNPAPDLAPLPKVEPETFMGFRRKDGRAAIRNEIWIIPTVGCVNDIAKKIVADNQDLVTGSIEGLYTFTHPFGCSQTGHDHAQTRKLLAALVRHPNAAAVLVLSLGCENLTHEQFLTELGDYDHDRVKFLTCQDVEDEFAAARDILKELAAYAGQFQREPIPVSDLVVGIGGSLAGYYRSDLCSCSSCLQTFLRNKFLKLFDLFVGDSLDLHGKPGRVGKISVAEFLCCFRHTSVLCRCHLSVYSDHPCRKFIGSPVI